MKKNIRGSGTTATRRGQRTDCRPRAIPGGARGLLAFTAVLLSGELAYADCTPQAGGSNYAATCTGVTTNQGGGAPGTSADVNGYGTGGDNNATITLANGASVFGTTIGVSVGDTMTIINSTGAGITGGQDAAIKFGSTGGPDTVINSGSITGPGGFGVWGFGPTNVTNNAGGVITGAAYGVSSNRSADITNYGQITTSGFGGVAVFTTATITNYAGGSIAGGVSGITVNQAATIVNSGSIAATNTFSSPGNTGFGVRAGANSSITNNNGGIITGGQGGISAGTGSSIVNTGNINGGVYGIFASAGGGLSIFNAGTIGAAVTDGNTRAMDAILFAGTGNTLTLAPGSVISGAAIGTGNDTLQLGGSGAASFDVSQLGATRQYRGFGTFNKIGDSNWTLTGTSTYAGPVNVNGGTLSVNGNLASVSAVNVNAGSTLGGTGTVGNTFIAGGTLAPGNSIGTLTVQGNLSFTAASSYQVEVSPSAADRTHVTGAATLNGATVGVSFAPGSYVSRQYTILDAGGGVNGTFNGPVYADLPANFNSNLSYDANDVYLNLALNFAIPGGLNANQQNVGNALTDFFNATGGIPMVFAALTPAGLTQASGETVTGAQQTTFNAMTQFMGVMTDPFIGSRGEGTAAGTQASPFAAEAGVPAAYAGGRTLSGAEQEAYAAVYRKAPLAQAYDPRWSVWAAGFGGSQTTDGNAALGSNSSTSSLGAVAVGADYRFSPDTIAGFALAGGGTSFSVDNGGTGRSDLFQAGAFVRHTVGPAYILAAAAYGFQDITTDRTVTIAGVDRLHAEFNANAYSGRAEAGYRLIAPWTGGIGITPYVAGQFTTFDLPAYAETVLSGATTFALAYNARSVTDSRSELGFRSDKSFAMPDAMLTLRGRLAWAHDFNPDRSIAATFQTLPGASFVVNGAAQPHDSALTTAAAEIKLRNGWSAAASFEGEFSDVTRSYAGKGALRYAW